MEVSPKIYLYKRIVQAKLFIDSHYSEAIDLDNIADEAYFSKFHFIRLFKNVYGKTPHQYLTQVRIDNAKILLHGNVSIADVCYSVGFDSITSFTGLFKRVTGKTPAIFQQYIQIRNSEIKEQPLNFIPNCFAEQNGWNKKSNFREAV